MLGPDGSSLQEGTPCTLSPALLFSEHDSADQRQNVSNGELTGRRYGHLPRPHLANQGILRLYRPETPKYRNPGTAVQNSEVHWEAGRRVLEIARPQVLTPAGAG